MKVFVKKNKNGFTLVELLAVLTILAVMMLIIIPITNNMVKDSRTKSREISVKNYISSLDKYLISSELNDIFVQDGSYSIMKDGSICLEKLSNNICNGKIIKVDLDGQIPTSGIVKIKNNKVEKYYNIKFDKFYASTSGITTNEVSVPTDVVLP